MATEQVTVFCICPGFFNVFPDAIISDFVKQETFCEGLVDLLVA